MNTLLLIDGNAIMHRAFHAIPPFKTKEGVPTNAVYGFMSMLYKSINDFHPDHIIVCFDTPKPTFRNKLLKEYQAQRPKMEDNFIAQFPLIRQLIDAAGITRLEMDGYEADDVIGTVAKKLHDKNKILVLTGDKDLFQLINHNVYVVSPKFGFSETIIYDDEAVRKKMGVPPKLIPDYKALVGDSSDNYKGAKGIGPKTAATLLHEFGTVDNVLKYSSKITNDRIRTLVESHKDEIRLSHTLATVKSDVPLHFDFDKTKFTGFRTELNDFLKSLEINSLRQRIFNEKKPAKQNSPAKEKKLSQPKEQIDLFS